MDLENFVNEFYKILTPQDQWKGEASSIKEIFEARLVQYGMTQNQAENLLGMEKRTLAGILDKSLKRVDVINLFKLGQFLGLDVDSLFKIYLNEQAIEVISDLENVKKKTFIISNFDLKNLHKIGFVQNRNNYQEVEKRIIDFFGLNSIYEYKSKQYIPAFSRGRRNASELMREFWVRSAYSHFERIDNPNPYDRDRFLELIPKIRPYTMNVEEGLRIVTQALYNIGITVIYQPHVTTTQIRGATFVIENRPSIIITDLNKNYATLWFALMHEIHHVLYDFDEIVKQVFHLTGEADLFLLQEDKADEFSREYLFSDKNMNYVKTFIDNHLIVSDFAKECRVHHSIIYNFYCFDCERKGLGNFWGKFRQYIPDSKSALSSLNVNSFKKESIEEAVIYIKEKVFNF